MRELIGHCIRCGKEVFCVGGNIEGAVIEGDMYCPQCGTDQENEQKNGKEK